MKADEMRGKLVLHCLHTIEDFLKFGPDISELEVLDHFAMWRAFVEFQQKELDRITRLQERPQT